MASTKAKAAKHGDNFKVVVRIRPLIDRELKTSAVECVAVHAHQRLVVVTKPENRRKQNQIGIDDFGELVRPDTRQTHSYSFDIVFGPSSLQGQIFDECARPIVESVLQGYNGSIIASGQTGSGKTFTVEGGVDDDQGLIPRATELIFSYIQNTANEKARFLVRTSYLEIYNESISDLIEPDRDKLRIREDGVGGVFVEGLSEHVVRNTKEVKQLLREGAQLRTTAATKMNKESSRSHAVFTIIVEHAEYDDSGGSVITIGKLRLIDLAGSERLDIDAQSKRQEETKRINVSLHTFAKVVTALTTPGAKHIPYRDSKLTRILQDCLGGNCKTTLIGTISPVTACYTETINTLDFAKRAKNIKNNAVINKDLSQKAMLSAYQAEIKKLKAALEDRDGDLGKEQIERLQRERLEVQKEKDAVLSQLEVHQKMVSAAQAEREQFMLQILQLEKKVLHGGSSAVTETDEFREALKIEQERIRKSTESKLETKLAELEEEKKRLQDERAEIEKQKEYIAKLRADFQPDGQKDDEAHKEEEQGAPQVKTSGNGRKPSSAPQNKIRPPPSGAHIPTITPSFFSQYKRSSTPDVHFPQRMASVHSRSSSFSLVNPQEPAVVDLEESLSKESFGAVDQGAFIQLRETSLTNLRQYAKALSHPMTGIPCQELTSGHRIFTGSAAVKWFMSNMQGIHNMQAAQAVGQRLLDVNVFTEIQGRTQFLVSDTVYYQFCDTLFTPSAGQGLIVSRPTSTLSLDQYGGSYVSLPGNRHGMMRTSSPNISSYSNVSIRGSPSSLSLASSMASLHLPAGVDLLEHFNLARFHPTEMHTAAIYGDRERLKALLMECHVDTLDAVGHTPLIYAVYGKQVKCCQLLIRCGANVNAANHYSQTPLILAAASDYDNIIKLLLRNGGQTHFVDTDGETIFHVAARSQNLRCLEYICKYPPELHGINERNHRYHTPLHTATTHNMPEHVRRLLKAKADLGVSDHNGRTALHYAVTENNIQCIQAITECTPNDVNLMDTLGCTALHLACREGLTDCVYSLLSCPSCDVNLKDHRGFTPLHTAVAANRPHIVRTLVAKGASVVVKDKSGKTPLHHCMELGYSECARAIQSSQSMKAD